MREKNKFLALVLVFSIVFSIFVTFFAMNAISKKIPEHEVFITARVTSDTGQINLTIADSLNIDVNNTLNTLNYGSCVPGPAGLWVDLGDNIAQGTGVVNCSGDNTTRQYIIVYNVGNVDVNVTITAECNASLFIGSPTASLNVTSTGCEGGNILNLPLVDSESYICNNVTQSGGSNADFNITSAAWIPNDAIGGTGACSDNQNQVTFTARKI